MGCPRGSSPQLGPGTHARAPPPTRSPTQLVDSPTLPPPFLQLLESEWKSRRSVTWTLAPDHPDRPRTLLFDRNYEDSYTDPGAPALRRTDLGTYVLAQLDGERKLLMQGELCHHRPPPADKALVPAAPACRTHILLCPAPRALPWDFVGCVCRAACRPGLALCDVPAVLRCMQGLGRPRRATAPS